jgi:hypothetical protein
VQILQTQDDAGGVKNRPRLGEDVGVDVHHEVAAGRVLHDEADVRLRLEAGEHVDEEGVAHRVGHLEDPLLGQQGLDLVAGDDVALLQRLDCKVLAGVEVAGKYHLAKVASTQHTAELEVFQAHRIRVDTDL